MTPNAIYQDALAFALEGRMPSLGLGSPTQTKNARFAIQNKAAAIAAESGLDIPTVRAEYKAKYTAQRNYEMLMEIYAKAIAARGQGVFVEVRDGGIRPAVGRGC